MAKFRSLKNSLIGGEISPTAFGRTDLPVYQHACKTLRNMIPLLSGGAYRRPGTLYESNLADTFDLAPRLIPFIFSQTEAYCLFLSKIIAGAGYVSGFRPTANSGGTTHQAITCTGSVPYSSRASHLYDDSIDVHYTQSADVLYLVHPDYIPYRVYRTSQDNFTSQIFTDPISPFFPSGANRVYRDLIPYRNQNVSATTMTINTATVGTGRTLTASAPFFNVLHVGASIKVYDGSGTYGCAYITAFTSSTVVTVEVTEAFGDTAAHLTWWESAWSDYRGWPRTIGFFQQRLVYGGNASQPDTLWFSKTGNYNKMSEANLILTDAAGTGAASTGTGPTGHDPFSITLASQRLNLVQWIIGGDVLSVGTQGDEWLIDFDRTSSTGFSIDSVHVSPSSRYGSDHTQSIRSGYELFFNSNSQDEIRGLIFNINNQGYNAEPIQLLYDEFPFAAVGVTSFSGERKIRQMAWDESRKTLWAIDAQGNLRGFTHDRQLQVNAWHSHQMGGFDSTILTTAPGGISSSDPVYSLPTGSVVSLAVVPNVVVGGNDIWLVVKRKSNGSTYYFFERIIGKNIGTDDETALIKIGAGSYYSDACVTGGSISSTTIGGIPSQLNTEAMVGTFFNSRGIFKANVIGGVVQAPTPPHMTSETYVYSVGLPFSSIVEPVRIEAGSQIGTSQDAFKRIHRLSVRVYRTIGCRIGRSATTLETIIFRKADVMLGKSAKLSTEDKTLDFNGDYDRDGYIYIIQEDPLPFCLLSIVAEGLEYD